MNNPSPLLPLWPAYRGPIYPFEVVSHRTKPFASGLLRLRTGSIAVDRYLQEQVEIVLAPQYEVINAFQLDQLRDLLFDEIRNDPIVREMLGRVTAARIELSDSNAKH